MPKTVKEETLWDFSISILLQNFYKIEGGLFGVFKEFSKKKTKNEKF